MPIIIKIADTPELVDEIYKLRHQVFCKEEHHFKPSDDGRVYDRYDTYPTSHHLVVLVDGKVVGSMRITEDSPVGIPADEFYHFRDFVSAGSVVVGGGMLCVEKAYRSPRVSIGLTMMSTYLSVSKGMDYIAAPINPLAARMFKRIGFRQIGDAVFVAHAGVTILPMLLAKEELNDFFMSFITRNHLHNDIGSFDCYMYSKGEQIMRCGDTGDMAFVIVDGEVDMVNNAGRHVTTLGVGEIIGGIELMAGQDHEHFLTRKDV